MKSSVSPLGAIYHHDIIQSRELQTGRVPGTRTDPNMGPGKILKIGSGPGESVYPDPTRELATGRVLEARRQQLSPDSLDSLVFLRNFRLP